MLQTLSDHAPLLNAGLNAAMVLIWVVYLQIFLVGHRRQSRSVIHIDLGSIDGAQARCLVTSLSSGAIYVQGIAADLVRNGHTSRMLITEREEVDQDKVEDPMSRTNRGTLQPGQTVDIGSLDDVIRRAQIRLGEEWTFDEIDSVTITVVAISGQAERIVGAAKEFCVERGDSTIWFSPTKILTRQIRPRQTRKEFNKLLRERKFE